MVEEAVNLNKAFEGVKEMVSRVQICFNYVGETMQVAQYDTVKWGGADRGGVDESIMEDI